MFINEADYQALMLRIQGLEERFSGMQYDTRAVVQSELRDRMQVHAQSESQFGLYTALCVDTVDIWKMNRVRFFCPLFHDPKAPIKSLPWAFPMSAMGGFDDCGLNWVPPAGSTVGLLFETGKRSSPFYIGTTWHRNRGPQGEQNWNYNVEEYRNIHEGNRGGYLVGPNDESQVFPPWNTESYNGFDLSSVVDFAEDPEAQKRITYPNIYGFSTPEKHRLKMVDGDAKCNRKWKRLEVMSSTGNWFMMKDDHLHYCGQWAHPSCGVPEGDVSCIEGQDEGSSADDITRTQGLAGDEEDPIAPDFNIQQGIKKERTACEGQSSNSRIIGGHPNTPRDTKHFEKQVGANPYFKHEQECRPYKGPQTPQNNKCDLPQSGIQFMSLSGHTFLMDDSVEEPFGEPTWQRATEAFNFGCNDVFLGRSDWISATGNRITLNDREDGKRCKRHEDAGIKLETAHGNNIRMSDHDKNECVAGEERGIHIQSTSNHVIELVDEGNEQCGSCRKEGGEPKPKANKAYMLLRTGYGLEIRMDDANSQESTVAQSIQIVAPQKDNTEVGPHILRFQESPQGCGTIFLRAGGYYVVSTHCDKIEVIGDEERNPANSVEIVSRHKLIVAEENYLNMAQNHFFLADEHIYLLANVKDDGSGSTIGPVAVFANGCLRLSTRILASVNPDDPAVNIVMLKPLSKCE